MDLIYQSVRSSSRSSGDGVKGCMCDILASCEFHSIRVNENLVQHPSNDISNQLTFKKIKADNMDKYENLRCISQIAAEIIDFLCLKVNVEREGILGCLLHYFPKIYNNVFLFIDLTTLGTFIEY